MTLLPWVALTIPAAVGVVLWWWRPAAGRARAVGLVTAIALLGVLGAEAAATAGGQVIAVAFGGWAAPFGIAFAADRLTALFSVLLGLSLVAVLAALRPGSHGADTVARSVPLLLLLAAALLGAFHTADLFNLFVMFELVLMVSYLLLQVPGGARARRAAFGVVAVNLVASLLFFTAVGLLYGLAGTVNLGDLAAALPGTDPALRTAALGMLVAAFAVKAGLVPLMFWLPASYPALSGPVAALFAGMMTKLGVYALLRTVPLLMDGTVLPEVLVWAGSASALLGVLGALGQMEMRRLLGFHIVSQVGYMVIGLGLLTVAGLAGALFYLTHHILVKTSLFLVADELERRNGTRHLAAMSPLAAGAGLAAAFALAGASLAGLPPFSGFFAKLALFQAAWGAAAWVALAVLVAASFATLQSMLKIWQAALGPRPDAAPAATVAVRGGAAPLVLMTVLALALAAAAGPVFAYCEAAARQLLEPSAYLAAVQHAAGRLSPGGAP